MKTSSDQSVHCVEEREQQSSVDASNHTARFWDRNADRYAAAPVKNQEIYSRKLAITRQYLHSQSEVLELGCGTGSTALAHAHHISHIRATDISSKMIEIATRKASAAGIDNIDFVACSIKHAGEPDVQYDAILALSLLHLLVGWPETIEAAHRMLKPGGVFVTSTMCMSDSYAWMRLIAPVGITMGLLPQISFFARTDLEQAMLETGFEIEHAWQPAPKSGLFLVARKLP